jgi:hypothetical protein
MPPSDSKVSDIVGKGAPDKSGAVKFRHGSSARYDSDFAANQPWVKISGKSETYISYLVFIVPITCSMTSRDLSNAV